MTLGLTIPALDGRPLGATLFPAATDTGSVVVINPGLGLRASLYHPLAAYLAAAGHTVLTYDYRGMGASAGERVEASFVDWARHDCGGALRYAVDELKAHRLSVVAHSTGGAFLGFSPLAERLDRIVCVATQMGYWRLWPGARKAFMWTLAKVVIPTMLATAGYVPGRRMGWGDDIPAGFARDWCRWLDHPDYFFGFPQETGELAFDRITASMLWYSFSDDNYYAPKAAVDAFPPHLPNASIQRRHLAPGDLGRQKLGHLGLFSRKSADDLWPEVAAFLSAP